jgi:hypothetical protein
MTQPTGDDSAPPKIHHVIMFQMAVNIFCVVLIIFSEERPDTSVANAVHWWIERSAGAIRILLFFEPWPSTEETEKIVEGMQIYRHVLAVSLLIALCSIMASRPYLPDWSATLSAKLKAAGYSKAKYGELVLTGYRRMIVTVAAITFLALFGHPYDKASIEKFYSSELTILRLPLLIGIASAFVLLAITFRRLVNNCRLPGSGRFPDDGFN